MGGARWKFMSRSMMKAFNFSYDSPSYLQLGDYRLAYWIAAASLEKARENGTF